jgi:hypothetical protein
VVTDRRVVVTGKRMARGFAAAHHWLAGHMTKDGRCSRCGKKGKTEWAFLRWPERYTKIASDYAEMCRSCHQKWDIETGERPYPVPPGEANAARRAQTHCKRGHLFDEANTYITPTGGRRCRTCQAEYMKIYKQGRKHEHR